jgi:AraC family transcriptional regulator of adaptative response / DNA-3-methyladenine glycosylase II
MPASRAQAITELARAVAAGEVVLDGSRSLAETVAALESLRGIGPWTAAYIALRALGEPDAFPSGDLGLRRALAKRDGSLPTFAEIDARAERWRPWRGYATLYVWCVEGSGARKKNARTKTTKTKEVSRATAA